MKPAGKLIIILSLCVATVLLFFSYKVFMRAVHPQKYLELVNQYADEYSIDPLFIYSVIKCESNFKKDAVSGAGALGIMQITPTTFKWLQTKTPGEEKLTDDDLFDEETSIKYGTLLLSLHLKEFQSNELALCAYHAGRGQVNEWLNDGTLTEEDTNLDHIPFGDTQTYVKRVMSTYEMYQKIY